MSHQPVRVEKNCLNCGTEVAGRYCQQCGQENIVPHQTFRHLVQHFIFDLFHFDGKFFETLKFLLFRPGRVPREFIAGRRVSYLDPIRMYLFTSAVFFLIFASMNRVQVGEGDLTESHLSRAERYRVAAELAAQKSDSNAIRALPVLLDTSLAVSLEVDSTRTHDSAFELKGKRYFYIVEPMDSVRASNFKLGNGWLGRIVRRRVDHFNERFQEDRREAKTAFIEGLFHRLPYMLFVSLPFFALLLKLLYRRRKNFFYADHLVFTLYHYVFNFILMLAVLLLARINVFHWRIVNWLALVLVLLGFFSLYKGMRNFYGQKRGRTLVKFLLLNAMAFLLIALLFIVFVLISIIQV